MVKVQQNCFIKFFNLFGLEIGCTEVNIGSQVKMTKGKKVIENKKNGKTNQPEIPS